MLTIIICWNGIQFIDIHSVCMNIEYKNPLDFFFFLKIFEKWDVLSSTNVLNACKNISYIFKTTNIFNVKIIQASQFFFEFKLINNHLKIYMIK